VDNPPTPHLICYASTLPAQLTPHPTATAVLIFVPENFYTPRFQYCPTRSRPKL